MNSNTVPKSQPKVVTLALLALSGAQVYGEDLDLTHNSAARLAADIFALVGDPAAPLVPGKQALLDAQLRAMKSTYAAQLAALKAGRDFCHTALGVLKPILGQRWNGAWHTAGFTSGSLAVPTTPLALLVQLRAFFVAHPEREGASLQLTAAQAQVHIETIQAAVEARETARGARWSVKAQRDAAFAQLRKRLSGLRAELAQLMPPTDDRWYAFGFRRPADGKLPTPVKSVTVSAGAPGVVLVSWPRSSGADSYRVTWRRAANESSESAGTIVTDAQFAITDLPSGELVIIGAAARNRSGETVVTEVTVLVT